MLILSVWWSARDQINWIRVFKHFELMQKIKKPHFQLKPQNKKEEANLQSMNQSLQRVMDLVRHLNKW